VYLKKPASAVELANVIQDYLDGRQHWRDRRSGSHPSGNRLSDRRDDGHRKEGHRSDNRGEASSANSGKGTGEKSGNKPSMPKVKSEVGVGSGSRHSGSGNFQPTCYGCGQIGHKKPECPNQVARVVSPTRQAPLQVEGKVGKEECLMIIDTGAQQSVVRADLVKEHEYLGRSVQLVGFNGASVVVPLAKVWINVGKYCIQQEVAVCSSAPEPVLLGLDVGFLDYLLDLERE